MNIDPKLPYQILHSHSRLSDGELTYTQLLDTCEDNKVGVIAFTDHDSLPQSKHLKELEGLKSHRVKYIIGTELSSSPPLEVKNRKLRIDIVGLFVDPKDKEINEYSKYVQKIRGKRAIEKINGLQDLGFNITLEEVKKIAGHNMIMSPHIVSTLLSKKRNLKRIDEFKKALKKEAKSDDRLYKVWQTLKSESSVPQIYTLFLRGDAYLPIKQKDIQENYYDFDTAVKLIHNAGGIAILAHYSFGPKRLGSKVLKNIFEEKRIDGAEVVYGSGANDYKQEIIEDMEKITKMVEEYDILKSGGADVHTKEHIEYYAKNKDLAPKSTNFIQEIIKSYNINLEFSSLKL